MSACFMACGPVQWQTFLTCDVETESNRLVVVLGVGDDEAQGVGVRGIFVLFLGLR